MFCIDYTKKHITPGITRRPERLLKMKSVVSAVGCMPLSGVPRLQIGVRERSHGSMTAHQSMTRAQILSVYRME